MTNFLQMASMLREQMSANLTRTDVLRPLSAVFGILLTATLIASYINTNQTLVFLLTIGLAINFVALIGAYGYCLFVDRDALRSEKYSLHKMAIEHGMLGDSSTGMFDPDADAKTASRLPLAPAQIEQKP